jgi:fumarate hydratase class II
LIILSSIKFPKIYNVRRRKNMNWRIEKDTMGEIKVPADKYYGAQTQRAVENFPVSGWKMPDEIIRSLAVIKWASANANFELGLITKEIKDAICKAAEEIYEGKLKDNFPIDVFQTGSGTSTNMNINEVIANRANEILGYEKGSKFPVHPNDHVNKCQSSNDVIPSAISISATIGVKEKLIPSLKILEKTLEEKSEEFKEIIKIGRTHLMDATPITLGQEFSGYKEQISHCIELLQMYIPRLSELALGGTAVGTGINAHPEFPKKAISYISKFLKHEFKETRNHFFSQATQDTMVALSGILKLCAVSLFKIANDIRWLGSGPRCGIGEINLPSLQPGSSIMPGKVNPVIPESVMMVCAHVIGSDVSITIGGMNGNFELNTFLPLIGYHVVNSINLLSASAVNLAEKCIKGIKPNVERMKELVEWSLALVTPLALKIGYDKSAEIAKKAVAKGKTIREILKEEKILSDDEIDKILDPYKMIKPNADIIGSAGG